MTAANQLGKAHTPRIQAPIVIDNPDSADWHDSIDVVVAGFGCAGACAALQLRELGAEVLILDRFQGGGSTAYSGGVIYAGGTKFQKEAGIEDDADEMFKYLKAAIKGAVADATLRRFCDESAASIDWLTNHGIPFSSEAYLEASSHYPPEGKFLYYTSNECTDSYAQIARPAPRGHRTKGEGQTGKDLFAALKRAVLASGARFTPHAPVTRLVTDRSGKVIGVEATLFPSSTHEERAKLYAIANPTKPFNTGPSLNAKAQAEQMEAQVGQRQLIRTRKGVIITSGSYLYNTAMMATYRPELASSFAAYLHLGGMGEDGSGIELGQSAGGTLRQIENYVLSGPLLPPPRALLHGIMVNSAGERVINEDAYAAHLGAAAVAQPDGKFWLLIDGATLRSMLKEVLFPGKGLFFNFMLPATMNLLVGGTRRGSSLEVLARKCGIDAAKLQQTVTAYNALATSGQPDPLGKLSAYMRSLEGAFYALNLAPSNPLAFRHCMSFGGLAVNEQSGAVVDRKGNAIPGLYAAGRSAAGLCSKVYVGGLSLGDAVFSGRRAALSCAGTQR